MEQNGNKLNLLYEVYRVASLDCEADPSATNKARVEAAKDALFADVVDYARRTISKINRIKQWKTVPLIMEDLGQAVALKVWISLPQFRQDCKFSTWLRPIANSVVLDEMKKKSRDREVPLLDWKGYDTDLDTHARKVGPSGAAPDSGYTESGYDALDERGGVVSTSYETNLANVDDNSEGDGHRGQPLLSRFFREREENLACGRLDLDRLLNDLHDADSDIFEALVFFKRSAKEVAEDLGWFTKAGKPDSRRVENQYAKIKARIKRRLQNTAGPDLDILPIEEKAIWRLREDMGYSIEAIAICFEEPESWVSHKLVEIKKKLKAA